MTEDHERGLIGRDNERCARLVSEDTRVVLDIYVESYEAQSNEAIPRHTRRDGEDMCDMSWCYKATMPTTPHIYVREKHERRYSLTSQGVKPRTQARITTTLMIRGSGEPD